MKTLEKSKKKILMHLVASMLVSVVGAEIPVYPVLAKPHSDHVPSQFEPDKSLKFNEGKWRSLTNDGIAALEHEKYDSAEQYFQAAVREASKAPSMSTYMIDSLVHTAETYRSSGRKEEAKEYFDQALSLVSMLKGEKCPLCKSRENVIPVIYGPHSEELEEWAKSKAAELGDFKAVTQKRKNRPRWYCKTCEKAY